jgi:hypothetical protein
MFLSGQRERCVLGSATSNPVKESSAGCWQARVRAHGAARKAKGTDAPARRLRAGLPKNDDFCFGNLFSYIKVLYAIHDDFCIPARKDRSSKINELAQNLYTFVYFCIPSLFARAGFVLNQRVNRHGSVTKVYKTAPEVSKRYTKPALAGVPRRGAGPGIMTAGAAGSGSQPTGFGLLRPKRSRIDSIT